MTAGETTLGVNAEDEPPVGAVIVESRGHTWERTGLGEFGWYCGCSDLSGWSWEEVVEDIKQPSEAEVRLP